MAVGYATAAWGAFGGYVDSDGFEFELDGERVAFGVRGPLHVRRGAWCLG